MTEEERFQDDIESMIIDELMEQSWNEAVATGEDDLQTLDKIACKNLVNKISSIERKKCYDFLMKLHMQSLGKHNYFYVAALQLMEEP